MLQIQIFVILCVAMAFNALPNYISYKVNLDVEGSYMISNSDAVVLEYPNTQTKNTFRVSIWSEDAKKSNPIKVIVQQENRVTSWQVPYLIEKDNIVYEDLNSSKTLCYDNMEQKELTLNKKFAILLSTSSTSKIHANVVVNEVQNFLLETKQFINVSLTPSQPVFYSYTYRNSSDRDLVFISILSPKDNICHTVSVQNKICPAEDQATDIKYNGRYQTVLSKGGILINKNLFPDGFFIVFQMNVDTKDCNSLDFDNNTANVETTVSFWIEERQLGINQSYKYSTFFWITILMCLGICGISTIISFCFYCVGTYSIKNQADNVVHMNLINPKRNTNHENRNDNSIITFGVNNFATNPKNEKQSKNFVWHITNVFIFYAIPVTQLMVSYQLDLNKTGNYDICYHNHYCSHPYGIFVDFNHILSNIGYFVFGAYFLFYVWLRSKIVVNTGDKGVPVYYGLYYAMGLALIFEGYFSANYHICPTQANFQFDTSFMYIMVCLCTLKLYQNRHPDISACAYTTFFVIGVHIFFAMIGLVFNDKIVMIFFHCFNLLLCFYISVKIYYFQNTLKWILQHCKNRDDDVKILSRYQFYLLLVVNALNFIVSIVSIFLYPETIHDFGSYILGLLIVYALIYLGFYIIMKMYHEGKWGAISVETVIYSIAAIITWVFAIQNFQNKVTNSQLTPAESRELNADCSLFHFYDSHDIWHLLSAPALFFSFMTIITIDNNMIFKNQNNIEVF